VEAPDERKAQATNPEARPTDGGEANPPVGRCPETGVLIPECPCPVCTARMLRDSGRGHLLDAFDLSERARRDGRLPR
jgi:hypothetical protein